MQKTPSAHARSRAEILAEIAALPPSVQGRISSYKNVRKNGTSVTYHNLQWWADGRNHAFKASADTVREIVGLHRDKSSAFARDIGSGGRNEADARAEVVCVMGDGTGMPMRRECLQGTKGRDGRARTREG